MIYQQPQTVVVKIQLQNMIALSELPNSVSGTDSFDVTFSDDEFSGEAAGRYSGGIWDD